jgi:hypothetical protein
MLWRIVTNEAAPTVLCGTHGKRTSAVVCGHHVSETDRILGFVENSSEPEDLQAWCDDCEDRFLREGEMTTDFRQFNAMTVVCDFCYARIRETHTKRG